MPWYQDGDGYTIDLCIVYQRVRWTSLKSGSSSLIHVQLPNWLTICKHGYFCYLIIGLKEQDEEMCVWERVMNDVWTYSSSSGVHCPLIKKDFSGVLLLPGMSTSFSAIDEQVVCCWNPCMSSSPTSLQEIKKGCKQFLFRTNSFMNHIFRSTSTADIAYICDVWTSCYAFCPYLNPYFW